MVSFFGTETSPSSGVSSPTTMRKSVVLPAPLGPTRPTFSPGFNWKEASTKINCLPYCLWIFAKEIMRNTQGSRGRRNEEKESEVRSQKSGVRSQKSEWPWRVYQLYLPCQACETLRQYLVFGNSAGRPSFILTSDS